jgi:DNA-directed RNA polymerase subunit RPC12/RpoP
MPRVAYTFFFYHWVDRILYQTLGSHRDTLVDRVREPLIWAIAAALSEGGPTENRTQLYEQLESALDDFQRRFAAYHMPAGDGEALGGTLLWEFGKYLGETLGRPSDVSVITAGAGLAAEGIRGMDIPALLRGYSPQEQASAQPIEKVVIRCSRCSQGLRLPAALGPVRVTCPACGEKQTVTT